MRPKIHIPSLLFLVGLMVSSSSSQASDIDDLKIMAEKCGFMTGRLVLDQSLLPKYWLEYTNNREVVCNRVLKRPLPEANFNLDSFNEAFMANGGLFLLKGEELPHAFIKTKRKALPHYLEASTFFAGAFKRNFWGKSDKEKFAEEFLPSTIVQQTIPAYRQILRFCQRLDLPPGSDFKSLRNALREIEAKRSFLQQKTPEAPFRYQEDLFSKLHATFSSKEIIDVCETVVPLISSSISHLVKDIKNDIGETNRLAHQCGSFVGMLFRSTPFWNAATNQMGKTLYYSIYSKSTSPALLGLSQKEQTPYDLECQAYFFSELPSAIADYKKLRERAEKRRLEQDDEVGSGQLIVSDN